MARATLIAPPERLAPTSKPNPRRIYSCPECGHVLRVSGLGRHRVYFELTDERADDPVMNRVCARSTTTERSTRCHVVESQRSFSRRKSASLALRMARVTLAP